MKGIILGGTMGIVLGISGINWNQWQFYTILVPVVILFTIFEQR